MNPRAVSPIGFLSVPYRDPDPTVQRWRADVAANFTAELIELGFDVFSPISHGTAIATSRPDVQDREWLRHGIAVLSNCSYLILLALPGAERSEGVEHELAFAERAGIPVVVADCRALEYSGNGVCSPDEVPTIGIAAGSLTGKVEALLNQRDS